MCTLAISFGADRRWPLVVAANRDERLGRPAETWALRDLSDGVRAAAPRDLLQGGTWIGISRSGVFSALTNHHAADGRFPDPERRSRGELVTAALGSPSVAAARQAVGRIDARRYNPFHLVVCDVAGGFLWQYDGDGASLRDFEAGLQVVTERDPQGVGARAQLVRARWPLDPVPQRLAEILGTHGDPTFDFPCTHVMEAYGTRSSAILRVAPSLAHSELFVADGPPCRTPFEDRSRLLASLAR